MSIITDALKKAEQERELKATRASKITRVALAEPESVKPVDVLLEQSHLVEAHIEQNMNAIGINAGDIFRKGAWLSSPRSREVLIISAIVGIVTSCLVILLVLPHWPRVAKDFSIVWRPFKAVSLFQVPPMYHQQNIFSERSHSAGENGVKLPFSLTGISVQGDKSYAIINGEIVQKGDSIDGAQVKEILERDVVLETRAGEIKLKIQS